jgi:hypothetical protein
MSSRAPTWTPVILIPHPNMDDGPTVQDRKNPAKIGARNSSFASFDLGVGVRLRGSTLQPDALARSRGRNTRITVRTRAFLTVGFFHVRGGSVRDLTENGASPRDHVILHHGIIYHIHITSSTVCHSWKHIYLECVSSSGFVGPVPLVFKTSRCRPKSRRPVPS